jgi:hypothetical protein
MILKFLCNYVRGISRALLLNDTLQMMLQLMKITIEMYFGVIILYWYLAASCMHYITTNYSYINFNLIISFIV